MTERELTAIVKGIMPVIREDLARELAQRAPKDGRDGKDADPAHLLTLAARIDALEQRTPRDGANGRDGKDADPAQMLTLQARVDTLQDLIKTLTPRDGRDGKDGAPGTAGPAGPPGPSGTAGRDAVLKGAVVLKRLDIRRFQFCWDDGTPMTILDESGTPVESVIRFPVPVRQGTWNDTKAYEPDDVVTDKGSEWIAKCATRSRPGEGASDWQLQVKRGAEGPRGKPGETGPAGRDLTQMDFEGRKW